MNFELFCEVWELCLYESNAVPAGEHNFWVVCSIWLLR